MREASTIDISPAARRLAEGAAARAGLPVGEWLNRVINEREDVRVQEPEPTRSHGLGAALHRTFGELRPGKPAPQRQAVRIEEASRSGRPNELDEVARSQIDQLMENHERLEATISRLTSSLEHLADMVQEITAERRTDPLPRSKRYA